MNFAFTTLLILILVAPGSIFKFAYGSSIYGIRSRQKNPFEEITSTIIPTIILQSCAVFFVEHYTKYYVDFETLGELILNDKLPHNKGNPFNKIRTALFPILQYHAGLFSLSYILGHGLRGLIRELKLDRKFDFLRFPNKWHYIGHFGKNGSNVSLF